MPSLHFVDLSFHHTSAVPITSTRIRTLFSVSLVNTSHIRLTVAGSDSR